jgi:hypothetical protein
VRWRSREIPQLSRYGLHFLESHERQQLNLLDALELQRREAEMYEEILGWSGDLGLRLGIRGRYLSQGTPQESPVRFLNKAV